MNYLIRRIVVGVCIALVMMCVHKFARADTWQGNGGSSSSVQGAADAACTSIYGFLGTVVANNFVVTDADNQRFYCIRPSDGRQLTDWLYIHRTATDPVCVSPQVLVGGVCTTPVAPDPNRDASDSCPAGQHHDGAYVMAVGGNGILNGCAAGPNPCIAGKYPVDISSGTVCIPEIKTCPTAQHRDSSNVCSPDPVPCPAGGVATSLDQCTKFVCPVGDTIEGPNYNTCTNPAVPAPVTNPSGGCPKGSINIGTAGDGTSMCKGTQTDTPLVNAGPPVTVNPPTSVTNPDGTNTTTNSTSQKNKDGSTTTTSTSCTPDAFGTPTCQTSSKTGAATDGSAGKADAGKGSGTGGGSGGAGTSPQDPPKDMCSEHPNLNVCQNSQVSAAGCMGNQSTTIAQGDAIQGAILKKISDDDCDRAVPSDSSKLYDKFVAGQDPLSTTLPSKANGDKIDLGSIQTLDQSSFLGNACFADKAFDYGGRQLVIPFSNVCPYLIPLRVAVMFAALMASYFMLSGAVLRS